MPQRRRDHPGRWRGCEVSADSPHRIVSSQRAENALLPRWCCCVLLCGIMGYLPPQLMTDVDGLLPGVDVAPPRKISTTLSASTQLSGKRSRRWKSPSPLVLRRPSRVAEVKPTALARVPVARNAVPAQSAPSMRSLARSLGVRPTTAASLGHGRRGMLVVFLSSSEC